MDAKYNQILDDEVLAFIQRTEDFYPPDAVSAPIEKQREYYDALCSEYDTGYPSGVSAKDRHIKGRDFAVPARDYTSANSANDAHIVYFHGGGFVVGGLQSHDSICADLCNDTRLDITAVDYRLAPEHPHPAAYEDCLTAYRNIANETDKPIILMGDSAGGTLAASVAHGVRGSEKAPVGMVLIYPALGGDMTKGSYKNHENAPMLTLVDIQFYHGIRGENLSGDVTATPLSDTDFSNLPPTVMITADCDPLRDDAHPYQENIIQAGGKAHWINEDGLVHGYLRARTVSRRASASFQRIGEAAKMLAANEWHY
jgi:acetyl esterase